MLEGSNSLKRFGNHCYQVRTLQFLEFSKPYNTIINARAYTCNILPKVRAPMVSHDLNGIQVILGNVIINDKVNAGDDQFIHHINALSYRVIIICFKERSCFGIQLLQIKGRIRWEKV